MYSRFWQRVEDILAASLFGRIFFAIVCAVGGAFKNSWLYSFFTSKSMISFGKNSFLASSVRNIIFNSKFTDFVAESHFVYLFSELSSLVFTSSVSLLSAYIIPAGILFFINSFGNVPVMTAFALIIMLGIVLLGVKTSVGSVIANSFLLGKMSDFFEIDVRRSKSQRNIKLYVFVAMFGIAVGSVSFFISFKLSVILFAAVLFLPYIISSPLLLIVLTFIFGVVFSSMPAFILSFLTFLVVVSRILRKKEKLPTLRAPYIIAIMYTFVIFIYTLLGFAGSDSILAGFIQFVLITIFFSVVTVINTEDKFKKLIYALSVCTLYPGLYGIYQFFSGQGGTGWSEENHVGGLARISSSFANPNVYGEFLVITLCIIIVAVLISDSKTKRVFFAGCFAIQLVNLALTYSRGCYIAAAMAVFIVVWCCDKRLLGFCIFALPLISKILPKNIFARILSVGSYLKDTSVLYRFSIWNGALRIVKNHWYIGSGIGTVAFTLFYQNYMLSGTPAEHSHNTFIQIAVELSVIGLALFLLVYHYCLKDVCNTVSGSNIKAKFMIIPLCASLVGLFIQGFFDYLFYNNIIFLSFWLNVGLLLCALNIVSNHNKMFSKS